MSELDKSYISPYDIFLYEFDRTHALSESQRKEIEKHKRIAKLRDEALVSDEGEKIWREF